MAAPSVSKQMDKCDFQETMASFPCMFNMPSFDHPVRNRLRNRKEQLMEALYEGIDTKEEERSARNSLTWIYYQLRLYDRATEMNESVMMETGYECVVALGNCVFMAWLRSGQVSDHVKLLDKLKGKPDFDDKVLGAKAQQAYCLAKIGNMYNLMSAVQLYEEILAFKEHDVCRYLLGLNYRRLGCMHGVEKYSRNKLNQSFCNGKAKECFERVAKSSDAGLKATSLVNMAFCYADSDQATLVGVENALSIDPRNSEVLTIGGKALMYIDITWAVTLLEKGVKLCPHRSVSHHQLGKAYIRQLSTMGRRDQQRRNEIEKKAEKHFRLAYETSGKLNISSLMELARLHQRMRNIPMAAKEALRLLKSRFAGRNAFIQVINMHALLFYLKLPNSHRNLVLSTLASIGVMNEASTDEERHAVWSTMFEGDQGHAAGGTEMTQNARKLCDSWHKNRYDMERVFRSISTFVTDGRTSDVNAVESEALSILRQGQNEEALLFLELVSLRPGMDISRLRDLHLKLLMTEAKLCLEDSLSMSSVFFRQSFDLLFCHEELRGDDPESDSDISIKIDMVVLFNDSIENASTLCADTAFGLEDAITTLFGLKVAFNPILDASRDGGQGAGLADFVQEHMTAAIVVVFEGDGVEVQSLLEKIGPFPNQSHEDNGDRRPSVVMVQCYEQPSLYLPSDLKKVPCLSLGHQGDEFPNLFCLKKVQEEADKCVDVKGVLQAYFQGNTGNVMTLFKHLIRQRDQ